MRPTAQKSRVTSAPYAGGAGTYSSSTGVRRPVSGTANGSGLVTSSSQSRLSRGKGAKTASASSSNVHIEVIEDRLFWVSGPRPPTSYVDAYFFSIDQELVYDPYNNDFGPLNLAMVHKFVRELVRLLADPQYKNFRLFHYTSNKYDK